MDYENLPLTDPVRVRSRLSGTLAAKTLSCGTHKTRCCYHVLRVQHKARSCKLAPTDTVPSGRAYCTRHIAQARKEREEDIERFGLLEVETRDALFRGEIGLEEACLRLGV